MNLFTAKKLTALRKYYSLSQEALAEKAGVSRQAVSKWERGEASPDTDNLVTLSRIYNVSLDDLLGEKSAEEIISQLEKEKDAEKTAEVPETLDTQDFATEGYTENPSPATEVYTGNPPDFSPSAPKGTSDFSQENTKKKKKGKKEKPQPLYPGVAKNMLKFPYIIIAAIVYIIIGYAFKVWHPTWLIFLTIPAYYLTAPAFFAPTKKKILMRLPAYYYIIMLYIFLGILFSLWAKTWILFLFIPVYYWVISMLKFEK